MGHRDKLGLDFHRSVDMLKLFQECKIYFYYRFQILVNFWSNFGQLLVNFGSNWGQFLVKFWSCFGQILVIFGSFSRIFNFSMSQLFLNFSNISQFLKFGSIYFDDIKHVLRNVSYWFIFNLFSQQILTISNCGQFFCQILVKLWSNFSQIVVKL